MGTTLDNKNQNEKFNFMIIRIFAELLKYHSTSSSVQNTVTKFNDNSDGDNIDLLWELNPKIGSL